jgi:hypothetical protein
MKKGYVLTLDALLSLMVVMVIYVLIMGIQSSINTTEITEFKKLHYTSEDTLQALSEKGVLDQICVQWALAQGDTSSPYFDRARNISTSYLSEIVPPRIGYRLMINDILIATNSSRLSENDSSVKTHSRRMLSGYNTSLPTQGYLARARINDTNVSYGSVFWNKDGCNWTIQFSTGSNTTLLMPKDYTGPAKCKYQNISISYDNKSAVNDAVYRLLLKNDTSPNNGKVDSPFFLPQDVITDVAVMSSVKSVSVPVKLELVLWMK